MRYSLVLFLALIISQVSFADDSKIESYVQNLVNDSLNVLKDDKISSNDRTTKIRNMLANNMDTTWMGKFTLGRIIKTLSESEINTFISTYKSFVLNSYAKAVSQYHGENVQIKHVQTMDEGFSIVQTQVIKGDGNVINVNYLVHNSDNTYKVCDIITEGISLINSQRAEFMGVIASKGIDSLISDLKQRT
ncbi:MAG: hypothetical protein RLZZ59_864 [Pseudomonadota bacterium]|jgi:phospholipid transport system substrate-binding protein